MKSLHYSAAIMLAVIVLMHASLVKAESLVSPHFEIDAINFAPTNSAFDFAPPVISGITVTSVTGNSAIVQWKTDISASSFVAYGLTTAYQTEVGQSQDRVTAHTVKMIGLSPNTSYHYQVKSADVLGRFSKSEDQILITTSEQKIAEVVVSDISLSSAIVSWKTSSLASASIVYGTDTNYGQKIVDESGSSTTNHTVRLSGLKNGTTYHFQIIGFDTDGQITTSDDYIFTTLTLPQILRYTIGTVTGNTAEISWESNIVTDSFVSIWKDGQDEKDQQSQGTLDLVTQHHLVITGLAGKTLYHFRIVGRDNNGNRAQTDVLSLTTPIDNTPPVITDIRSEISTNSKDDRLQLVISWNTDEVATSQVEYNIGVVANGSYKLQSALDSTYNLNHTLILDKLKPSTNYHFRVKASDQAGNAGYSTDYSVLTPQQQKSLLQIILSKLEETFGWLRNVRIGQSH